MSWGSEEHSLPCAAGRARSLPRRPMYCVRRAEARILDPYKGAPRETYRKAPGLSGSLFSSTCIRRLTAVKVNILSSTIAQKVIVGLSGLMLCGFLVVHLVGNLLLYDPTDQYEAYNHYAHALHSMALLPLAEIMLLVLFVAHV